MDDPIRPIDPPAHMNTIADEWAQYEKRVLAQDASQVQRIETRRAFYAGAWAVLQLQERNAQESTNACLGLMAGWYEECQLFASQVAAGAA